MRNLTTSPGHIFDYFFGQTFEFLRPGNPRARLQNF